MTVVVLGQVVRRIQNQEINESVREKGAGRAEVLVNDAVGE
jgi:hypothetical protein